MGNADLEIEIYQIKQVDIELSPKVVFDRLNQAAI